MATGWGFEVIARASRVSWYRLRTTWHKCWSGYVTVVLLLGLAGGLAMGAIAGARRQPSAFPAYLAATDASDMRVQTYDITNENGFGGQSLRERLAQLPPVTAVASAPNLLMVPVGGNGRPLPSAMQDDFISVIGSVGGECFRQDRVSVAQGEMANPKSSNEIVATA